jgi:hypothetical protein
VVDVGRVSESTAENILPETEIQIIAADTRLGSETKQQQLSRKLRLFINDFKVSPDRQSIALAVKYQLCIPNPSGACFGMSAVSLLDIRTQALKTIWTKGAHLDPRVFCSTEYYARTIEWADEHSQLLVFNLTNETGRCGHDMPLFAFDQTNHRTFDIGLSAVWSVNPKTQKILSISEFQAPNKVGHTLHIINLSLKPDDKNFEQSQLLGEGVLAPLDIGAISGAILDNYVVIAANDENEKGQIIQFDLANLQSPKRFDAPFQQFPTMTPAPDGSIILLQTPDGMLLGMNPLTMQVQPFSVPKVSTVKWLDSNTILLSEVATNSYRTIDKAGKLVQEVSVVAPAREKADMGIFYSE